MLELWAKIIGRDSLDELFLKMVNSGYYDNYVAPNCSTYMCVAIDKANRDAYIDYFDSFRMKRAIRKYLKPSNTITLRGALIKRGYKSDFETRVLIYNDWNNRPKLTK